MRARWEQDGHTAGLVRMECVGFENYLIDLERRKAGAGTAGQQTELLLAHQSASSSLGCPLKIQLTADMLGKAMGGDPSAWASATHVTDPKGIRGLGVRVRGESEGYS